MNKPCVIAAEKKKEKVGAAMWVCERNRECEGETERKGGVFGFVQED